MLRSIEPTGVTPDVDEWLTSLPHAATLREVVRRCADAGLTIAVAESFTAGLLATGIAAEPDSGQVFVGSAVTYATDAKRRVLGVRPGPVVHPDAAADMATGALRAFGSDLALATTGVAGPESQEGRPPGTVVIAVAERDGDDEVRVSCTEVHDVGRESPGRVRALGAALAADALLATVDRRTSGRRPAQAPSDHTTLADVVASYAADGWDADLDVTDDGSVSCSSCGQTSPASTAVVASLRRLEGASDPADMAAVLAMRCPRCGRRGTAVVRYGPEASSGVALFFAQAGDGRGEDELDPAAAPQDRVS